jgi:hypothetical protein
MFQTKFAVNIKTHLKFSQVTDDNVAHAICKMDNMNMKYVLLFYGNNGYAKQCYVETYIVCLVLYCRSYFQLSINSMYQYNDRLTQLFTNYKYIWLWLQCFDPYLGHRRAYVINFRKCSTCLGLSCQAGSRVVYSIVHRL